MMRVRFVVGNPVRSSHSDGHLRLVAARFGFSLVELVIVILIMGILAAVSVGRITDIQNDVVANTLKRNVAVISDQIDMHSTEGFPEKIDPKWFVDGHLPPHPQNRIGISTLQIVNDGQSLNPKNKVIKPGVGGAYWYNADNGIIRARVGKLATAATSLELYNRVNGTQETSLGNYKGGGGS